MRSQSFLLALLPLVAATPIPSTSNYGDWSNWQTWQPTWLSTIAPQITCSTTDTSSPISPTTCTNCSQPELIAFLAEKWQPYIDTIFTNLASDLSSLTITESHVTDVLTTLKSQFAGDFISTIQFSLYSPQPSSSTLAKRHGNSTGHPLAQPYQNYTYQGCMTNFASKALVQAEDTNFGNLTNEKCIDYCRARGFSIAGTQSGSQCFCGNALTNTTLVIDEAACATSCSGDDTQVCGDNQKLSVYATYNVSGTTFNRETVRANWEEVGCVLEGPVGGNHTLRGAEYACLGMTVEMCMDFCDVMGFPVAGVEYGGECYCGDKFEYGGGVCSDGCNVPCIGDATEMCGGDWKLNVYQRSDTKTPRVDETCEGQGVVAGARVLGDCTEHNFTSAWTGTGVDWRVRGVVAPNATDVCGVPCEFVEYFPWFMWRIHENLRLKIADRLKVDWPARIGGIIGETCGCEVEEIANTIAGSGNVVYGLDGIADTWLCDLIAIIDEL